MLKSQLPRDESNVKMMTLHSVTGKPRAGVQLEPLQPAADRQHERELAAEDELRALLASA